MSRDGDDHQGIHEGVRGRFFACAQAGGELGHRDDRAARNGVLGRVGQEPPSGLTAAEQIDDRVFAP